MADVPFAAELAEYRAARAALAAAMAGDPDPDRTDSVSSAVYDATHRVDAAARALAAAVSEAELEKPVDSSRLMHRRFLELLAKIGGDFADVAARIDEIRRVVNVAGGSSSYAGEAERVLHAIVNMLPNCGLDRLPSVAAEADEYREDAPAPAPAPRPGSFEDKAQRYPGVTLVDGEEAG
jgi:hypothetical protein